MSYLGYKPADQDKSVIDWSGLTKQISDDLLAEKKRRDDSKAFLDQENAKQLQKINEFEQTQDPQANIWMTKQIQNARAFMLENQRLMKRGLRSVNDKRLVQQNVMNTYADVNNVLKNYNAKLIELDELGGKSNEALQEVFIDFARLKDRMIHNDPNTGAGYIADVDPSTGEINEKTLMPVHAINNMQQQGFKPVNVTEEVNKAVDKLGTWKVALSSTSDISNVRLNPKYQQTIDDLASSILSSDEKKASVLLDYLDLDYSRDADDAAQGSIEYDYITGYDEMGRPQIETRNVNIGKVLMELGSDGRLKHTLTKEQEELAKEAIKSNIESKLLFETSKQFVQPRKESEASKTGTAKNLELFNLSHRLAQGDTEAISIMKNQGFKDLDPDTGKIKTTAIGDVLFTEDDIIFYDDLGGILKTVSRTESAPLELAQIIRGGKPADDVLAAYSLGEKEAKGVIPGIRGKQTEIRGAQTISQGIPVEEKEAVDFIKRRLKGTKFQDVIEVDWTWGDRKNEITLTHIDGDSQDFDTSDKEGIAAWLNQYDANLKEVLPKGADKKEGIMSEFSTQEKKNK